MVALGQSEMELNQGKNVHFVIPGHYGCPCGFQPKSYFGEKHFESGYDKTCIKSKIHMLGMLF